MIICGGEGGNTVEHYFKLGPWISNKVPRASDRFDRVGSNGALVDLCDRYGV